MMSLLLLNCSNLCAHFIYKKWTHFLIILMMSMILLCKYLNFYSMAPSLLLMSNFMMLIIDNLSLKLIYLNFLVMMMSVMASMVIINYYKNLNLLYLCLISLNYLIISCFMSSHFLLLYILFEISVFPMLMMILLWGYQPERMMAMTYFFIYTCLSSLPFFLSILFFLKKSNSLGFFLPFVKLTNFSESIKMVSMILFFVKCPVYGVHLWLPKAHVEAPVAGSVILAAIMLKFGSYGLYRLLNSDLILSLHTVNMMTLFLWGGLLTCFICLIQLDLKSLIAYSSVSHMSILCCSLMTLNYLSLTSSVGVMLSHGLTSMLMFILANNYYEMFNTRMMFMFSGLLMIFPFLALWMFLILWSNASIPPTINFNVELILFLSIVSFSFVNIGFLILISCLTLCYMMLIFINSQYGEPSSGKTSYMKYKENVKISSCGLFYMFFIFMNAFMM